MLNRVDYYLTHRKPIKLAEELHQQKGCQLAEKTNKKHEVCSNCKFRVIDYEAS